MEKALEMLRKQDELRCRFMDEAPLPGQEEALELIWRYRPTELDEDMPLSEKYALVNKAWQEHKDGLLPR